MTSSGDATGARPKEKRALASIALIVVASLLLPLAGITVWVRNQVLNTDRYLETVHPLADDPAIRASLADRISRRVIEATDLEARVAEVLGEVSPRAEALAPFIAASAQNLVRDLTEEALASDQFQTFWDGANRRAHEQIVDVLTGREGKAITTDQGQVVLQLDQVAENVATRVEDRFGFVIPESVMTRLDVEYVLFESEDLASAQAGVRLLDRLAWITVILTLALFVIGVAIAGDKRAALKRVGLGMVVSMAVTLLAYGYARSRYLDAIPSGEQARASGQATFDAFTRFVERALRMLLVVGLVIIAGSWLAGPSSVAQRIRATAGRLTGRAGSGAGSVVDLGPVPRWVGAHASGLHAAVAVLGLAALVAWEHPTGLSVLLVALLCALAWGLVNIVAAAGRAEPSPATE